MQDKDTFDTVFRASVEDAFSLSLYTSLAEFSFSPLRFARPRLEMTNDDFLIYSGVYDNAPAMCKSSFKTKSLYSLEKSHFERKVQFSKAYSINTNKIDKVFSTTDAASIDDCAKICIYSLQLANDKFKCLSFDICLNSDNTVQLCSFYNSSHVEALIDNADHSVASTCDHYSSI